MILKKYNILRWQLPIYEWKNDKMSCWANNVSFEVVYHNEILKVYSYR